ncbi:hypothetical protein LCGC14_0225420 [marine sediment metagenome]|uniref:Uncharacterized protein n=1 Tax=marine sediment metagenome TaxID=412755 RepID=A0A0F9XGA3_9ZZZZ
MNKKEKLDRIKVLETKAKQKYCELVNWGDVINELNDDDKVEYWDLAKDLNLFGDDYEYE